LLLLFRKDRKDMRPTTRYSSVNGQVIAEKLHRQAGAGRSSKRAARCAAELIDIHLQKKLGLTAGDAALARQALVEVWKEALEAEGIVWTPAGVLAVANKPRVQRAKNSDLRERLKLQQRKVGIVLGPNPKYFPEPKKTEYTYKQYGIAKQRGLIEEKPPRPKPLSPPAIAMRQQSPKPRKAPVASCTIARYRCQQLKQQVVDTTITALSRAAGVS
jgi:hypothetical protein